MPSGHTNNFHESVSGLGHVTPTIFGSTVGYPSDSLASCLHTYYVFFSTLDYKFLFDYLQLWWSYAILSETTHRIFYILLELNL